jgi:predicted N-acetyltransferase YhbS
VEVISRRALPDERDRRLAVLLPQGWERGNVDVGEPWVAEADGEIVGTLRLLDAGDDAIYVADVIVREDLRGRGIGAGLMREAMSSRPSDSFFLVCHEERAAFYGRLGYEEIAKVELPDPVAQAADLEGDLTSDHEELHHFMVRRP